MSTEPFQQDETPHGPATIPTPWPAYNSPNRQRRLYVNQLHEGPRPPPTNTSRAYYAPQDTDYYPKMIRNALPQNSSTDPWKVAGHQYGAPEMQAFTHLPVSVMHNVQQAHSLSIGQSSIYQPTAMQVTAESALRHLPSHPNYAAPASSNTWPTTYPQIGVDQYIPLQNHLDLVIPEEWSSIRTGASVGTTTAEGKNTQATTFDELEDAYARYQMTLKAVFQNILDGDLTSAGHFLCEASEWLLSHVVELGGHSLR